MQLATFQISTSTSVALLTLKHLLTPQTGVQLPVVSFPPTDAIHAHEMCSCQKHATRAQTRQEQHNNSAAALHVAVTTSCFFGEHRARESCRAMRGAFTSRLLAQQHVGKTSIEASPAISSALQVASVFVIALTAAPKVWRAARPRVRLPRGAELGSFLVG